MANRGPSEFPRFPQGTLRQPNGPALDTGRGGWYDRWVGWDRPATLSQEATMKYHPSITEARVVAAVENSMFGLDNPGFCLACGEDADGCEPDARGYECEACGKRAVFGAEECMLMGVGQ